MTDAEKMMLSDAIEYAIEQRISAHRWKMAFIAEAIIVVLAIIGGLLCG